MEIRTRKPVGAWLAIALVAVMLVSVVAGAHDAAREGGTLEVSLQDSIDTLDSFNSGLDIIGRVLGLVSETLLVYDENLMPHPHLAKSWEVADDQLSWTFHLLENVTYHDGTAMTAETIAASLRLLVTEYWNSWQFSKVDSVNVLDDFTVQLTLKEPFPTLHYWLADPWNFLDSVAAREQYGDRYGFDMVVGTGPYKFVEWVRGERVVLERNEDYTHGPSFLDNQGPAYFDKIIFREIPEPATRAAELEYGVTDLAAMLDETVLPQAMANPDLNSLVKPSPWVIFLGVNSAQPALADVRVRLALSHAIDRQALLDAGLNGIGRIADGFIPPSSTGYWEGAEEYAAAYQSYDLDLAKELLASAGWVDTNGDGTVDKDGTELVLHLVAPSSPRYAKHAEVVQYLLPQAGVGVDIESVDLAAALAICEAGEYDIVLLGWKYNIGTVYLSMNCHSSYIPNPNYFAYDDPILDALIDRSTNALTEEERTGALNAAQMLVISDAIIQPLVSRGNNLLAKKRVGGIERLDAHPWWPDLVLGLELYFNP